MFDTTPKLVTWNKAMVRLLDFPEALVRGRHPFESSSLQHPNAANAAKGDIETGSRSAGGSPGLPASGTS